MSFSISFPLPLVHNCVLRWNIELFELRTFDKRVPFFLQQFILKYYCIVASFNIHLLSIFMEALLINNALHNIHNVTTQHNDEYSVSLEHLFLCVGILSTDLVIIILINIFVPLFDYSTFLLGARQNAHNSSGIYFWEVHISLSSCHHHHLSYHHVLLQVQKVKNTRFFINSIHIPHHCHETVLLMTSPRLSCLMFLSHSNSLQYILLGFLEFILLKTLVQNLLQ